MEWDGVHDHSQDHQQDGHYYLPEIAGKTTERERRQEDPERKRDLPPERAGPVTGDRKALRRQNETVCNQNGQVHERENENDFGCEQAIPPVGASDPELAVARYGFFMHQCGDELPPR